jgi:hypothetical protein
MFLERGRNDMRRGSLDLLKPAGLILVLAALAPVQPAAAQFALGGNITMKDMASDEPILGLGGRAFAGIPLTGVGAQATLDFFDEDCGFSSCEVRTLSLDVLFSLNVPFVLRPYFGGGVSTDSVDGVAFNWGLGDLGWNLVGGVVFGGAASGPIRPFAEGRYDLGDGETIISAGVLFYLF